MAWQPPTPQQIREHALRLRAGVHDATNATIARLRVTGIVLAIIGVLLALCVTPLVVLLAPENARPAAFAPLFGGVLMAAFGLYSLVLYRPLPKELLQTGVPTPAVVLSAGMVGPTVETRGFGVEGTLMRHSYRLEVFPQGAAPYQVEVRTFDGPMVRALNRPPVTVYVDRANRMRVCPDWSTLPQGA
jgi:hypothetical protein